MMQPAGLSARSRTSPLNYLIQINCDHVLPTLYKRVLVPSAVVEELCHPKAGSWASSIVTDTIPEARIPQATNLIFVFALP